MSLRLWTLLGLMIGSAAWAGRSHGRPVPLLPPPEPSAPLSEETEAETALASLDTREMNRPRSRTLSYSRFSADEPGRRSSPWLLGLEMGTQGRQNTTSSDALGLKLLWGGRAFLILPVASKVYLKPSVGFFYRRESVASIGISEHMAEGGLNVQYAFSRMGSTNWLLGLVQRVEVSFSRTSVSALKASDAPGTVSGTSAAAIRYRLGPSLGLTHAVTPTIGMLLDLETTFSFTSPVKPYGGLVGGLIFKL